MTTAAPGSPLDPPHGADLALAAASAAAAVLPSVEPLTAAGAQPGNEHVAAAFSGAVVAELEGARAGRIAVLVGEELTGALESSPLEGLDLAAATQPALDAVANTLGVAARAAQAIDLDLVVSDLGAEFTVVPLIGAGVAASVLIQDHLLAGTPEPGQIATLSTRSSTTASGDAAAQSPVPPPVAGSVEIPHTPSAGSATGSVTPLPRRGIEMLHGVDMEVTVELGRTRMTVRDLLALTPGAVLELDRAAGSPADLLVNGRLIARGEVVVIDEDFGLRVTEILDDSAAI